MFPFFISTNSFFFIYPLFSHNVTRFLFCLPPPYNCFCMCVCLCVNLCVFLLFWSPLSLFALSCSFALTLCLALAPSCTKLITVFSSLVAALYIFPLAFSRTHTSRSLFVFLFFLLSLSLCFAVFPSSLFCFVVFFFSLLFRNSHFIARPAFPILPSFSFPFFSCFPASRLVSPSLVFVLFSSSSFLPSFRFKFTQFLIV